MDKHAATRHLVEGLPEFGPAVEEHLEDNGELLFHLVMGDLARFYMAHGLDDAELRRRFWMTVERLAASGDDYVENALGVSLVEWFAWGSEREKQGLRDAMPLHGPATRGIVDAWRDDLDRPEAR